MPSSATSSSPSASAPGPRSSARASVVLHDVGFTWPDGTTVLDRLDATFPTGRTGLIGRNGSGKTTLVRLLAGELRPTSGHVEVPGAIGYVRQDVTLDPQARTVGDLLGLHATLAALARVDAGTAELDDFDLLEGRWDAPDRARASLGTLDLAHLGLDRPIASLSGGELTLLGLAAAVHAEPDVLLLDEPTNNLDRHGRARLGTWLAGWTRPVVVVSHDRELLAHVDQIAELHPAGQTSVGSALRIFGGAYAAYVETVAREAETADRAVRSAEADLRRQRREQQQMRVKLDRRQRTARAAQRDGGVARIVAGNLQRAAEVSAARLTDRHAAEVARARDRLQEASERVRDDDLIRIDLPDTTVPAGRDVVVAEGLVLRNGLAVTLHLRGPERVAITGPNGVGKTTLIDTLTGTLAPRAGTVRVQVPWRVLPQRMQVLDEDRTVLEAVDTYTRGPDGTGRARTTHELRAELARFLLTETALRRSVRTLSGGERFRATLAGLLLAQPAPQLLVLDEPTNNLDLDSVSQLVSALAGYRGALLVISHDEPFLAELGLDRRIELGPPDGGEAELSLR